MTEDNETNHQDQGINQPGELKFVPSEGFFAWLRSTGSSLAFTARRVGKLFMAGSGDDGRYKIFERTFAEPTGVVANENTLWLATQGFFIRMENAAPGGKDMNGYDSMFIPQVMYTTGDLAAHEIALDGRGEPVFVNTRFSCLAKPSSTHSFSPVWLPPFITSMAPEDKCHLNGLCMDDELKPAYATACSTTDTKEGWREVRTGGGVVMDVATGEIVMSGLSMPHSPRLFEGKLWVLNGGRGELGYNDGGEFKAVAWLPGFLRGLNFLDGMAVVSVSKPRTTPTFEGLPLEGMMDERGEKPQCGILVVDPKSGEVAHSLMLQGMVEEIQDVAVLPGTTAPMALGLRTASLNRSISIGPTVGVFKLENQEPE